MNSKDKGKSKLGLLGVAAAVILVVIVAGAVFMKRYAPSKQWMSGYDNGGCYDEAYVGTCSLY